MSVITSFEINATDLARAAEFYGKLLGREVPVMDFGGEKGALLSAEGDAVMGVIRAVPEYAKPSDQGNNIYFRIDGDFDEALARVEALGGKIVVPKMEAAEFGTFAWILDSEGNRIGLNKPAM